MKDHFGRKIEYLRISITERCNLRCRYCMPEGSVCSGAETELTVDEILKVGAAAAALGIHSVKVTGGEPLVRKECGEIIQKLKGLPGIERVTLTTNGIFLPEQLGALRAAAWMVSISVWIRWTGKIIVISREWMVLTGLWRAYGWRLRARCL